MRVSSMRSGPRPWSGRALTENEFTDFGHKLGRNNHHGLAFFRQPRLDLGDLLFFRQVVVVAGKFADLLLCPAGRKFLFWGFSLLHRLLRRCRRRNARSALPVISYAVTTNKLPGAGSLRYTT